MGRITAKARKQIKVKDRIKLVAAAFESCEELDRALEEITDPGHRKAVLEGIAPFIEFEPRPRLRGLRALWRSLRCSHDYVYATSGWRRCNVCGKWSH